MVDVIALGLALGLGFFIVLSSMGMVFYLHARIRVARELGERLSRVSYDGVLQVDAQAGEIVHANQASEQMLGFDTGALDGRSLSGAIWPNEKVREVFFDRVRSEGAWHQETVWLNRNGTELPVMVRGSNIGSLVLLVVRDLTERRAALRIIRESDERFNQVIQFIPHPLLLLEMREGTVIEVNRQFVTQFGYLRERLVGERLYTLPLWPDQSICDDFLARLANNTGAAQRVTNLQCRDGRRVRAFMVAKTTCIDGEIIGLLTLMDVAPLRDEGDWWRIASAPEDLDLSERTAHELNNILTPIMGYAEMALDDTPADSRLADDIRHITQSVIRAQRMLLELRKTRATAAAEEQAVPPSADGKVRPPGVPLS